MRTHQIVLGMFLGFFLVVGQAHAGWVPVATVNEKTPGHLCDVDDNGLDLFCGVTNPEILADGTISATAFVGDGSSLTGISTASADQVISGTTNITANENSSISFTTNGTERMVLDNSGNMGLGTTNPQTELEVAGTISATNLSVRNTISTSSLFVNGTEITGFGGGGGGGTMEFIESIDLSNDAAAEFTGFDSSKYDVYVFSFGNVTPSTDDVRLRVRTSTDGGSSYDSGSSDYAWVYQVAYAAGAGGFVAGDRSSSFMEISERLGSGSGKEGASGTLQLMFPHLAKKTIIKGQIAAIHYDNNFVGTDFYGIRESSADVDAVQFFMSSGNLQSGTITMYGIKAVSGGSGGGSGGGGSDDLGNHTASQTLNLNGNWLSGDGDAEGLQLDTSGAISTSGSLRVAGPVSATTVQLNSSGSEVCIGVAQRGTIRVNPSTNRAEICRP